ncbi:hypothetical protein TREPR_2295 [Treponema primitia ZAS-2]|uniref:Uncharacterized protein n=1 Tax=Treponema primitia (strain ATCC BAA-887 / DSM 12427 / ZAS-2) TaxID=545694 RepID=F5YI10_TREPZ|nr:hypothetical protein [Treponema primitia]AEF84415.1 hypothetical protein TREPR_2295 [Treponema primitia ZAS-2]
MRFALTLVPYCADRPAIVYTRTVLIKPESTGTLTDLPPGDLVITVTVGTGIKNLGENSMIAPVSFYYRTNTLLVRNVYQAEKIWAAHDAAFTPFTEEMFIYTTAASSRDRRLPKKESGKYEVTLYFTAPASNTAMTDTPNKVTIADIAYANLAGGETMSYRREQTFTLTAAENTLNSAGAAYLQANSLTEAYKFTYTWDTPLDSGIIRLVVLPYRDTGTADVYTDDGDIAPDTWGNADAEGRFVTVVLDNAAPSGSAILSLSGYAPPVDSDGGYPLYNYGTNKETMTLSANFNGVADNGSVGIIAGGGVHVQALDYGRQDKSAMEVSD